MKSLPCTGFHQANDKFALYSSWARFETNSLGVRAGKEKLAKQNSAADTLIEAQLFTAFLFFVYRHLEVTTLDVQLHFLLYNVLLRTGKGGKKVLSLYLNLGHISTSIHCIFPLSFFPAAISVASGSTSPQPVMLQERQQCGVTVTQKHRASRTSTTWHGSHYTAIILAAERLCADDTKKSFFQSKFWGGFGPHKARGHDMTLYLSTGPLASSPLWSLLGKLLRYECN